MPTDRYLDLLKQGFMKPIKRRKVAKKKSAPVIVACEKCRNWHPKGRHVKARDAV